MLQFAKCIITIVMILAHRGHGLSCFECENCVENQEFMSAHIRECPDKTYISCIRVETKFAHHKTISRSCSQAPSLKVPDCSSHLVNFLEVDVCICSASLCNEFISEVDLSENIHNDEPINYNVYTSSNAKGGLVTNSNQLSNADNVSKVRDGGVVRNKAGMRDYKSSRVLARGHSLKNGMDFKVHLSVFAIVLKIFL